MTIGDRSNWCAYGQTSLAPQATAIDDVAPSVNGLVGEISSWPYVVPQGFDLEVQHASLECLWGATMVLWIGDGPPKTSQFLPTWGGANGYGDGSNATYGPRASFTSSWAAGGMKYRIPSGAKVHLRLVSGYQQDGAPGGNVYGWGLTGELIATA